MAAARHAESGDWRGSGRQARHARHKEAPGHSSATITRAQPVPPNQERTVTCPGGGGSSTAASSGESSPSTTLLPAAASAAAAPLAATVAAAPAPAAASSPSPLPSSAAAPAAAPPSPSCCSRRSTRVSVDAPTLLPQPPHLIFAPASSASSSAPSRAASAREGLGSGGGLAARTPGPPPCMASKSRSEPNLSMKARSILSFQAHSQPPWAPAGRPGGATGRLARPIHTANTGCTYRGARSRGGLAQRGTAHRHGSAGQEGRWPLRQPPWAPQAAPGVARLTEPALGGHCILVAGADEGEEGGLGGPGAQGLAGQ